MNRYALAVPLVATPLLLAVVTCQNASLTDPPACATIAPIFDAGTPDVVWGFADLHAHPAIEKAFGSRLVWGTAIDTAPVNAAELPMIDPCPVETHDRNASNPIDHEVGSLVFPQIAGEANFAHAPVGQLSYRPSNAWPNARDVIHQQMNVASIRRAYEGGLRLMFASTTDDQVIDVLLQGPNMLNGFVPSGDADYDSARAQLELIEQIVQQNFNWMEIAKHSADARRIINEGKLAVVLSLEMNGLSEAQVDTLVDDFGVAHIIPIHLIDNDVGGTAATSPLFNASSSLVSELYRSDHLPGQYIDIAGTTSYGRTIGWPLQVVSLTPAPLYANIGLIPYPEYSQDLCYEPLSQCAGASAAPDPFVEIGEQNLRGLCTTKGECEGGGRPGQARILHFMQEKMFVDLSHMSARSVDDTLSIVDPKHPNGFPFVASHGDFTLVNPGDPPSNERNLAGDPARQLIKQGGVLGIGTGLGGYNTQTVIEARGGPLLSFNPSVGQTTGCVVNSAAIAAADASVAGAAMCAPTVTVVTDEDGGTPVRFLQVETNGGISSVTLNAHPFVRIEVDGPADAGFQNHVFFQPMDCSSQGCIATVDLGVQTSAIASPPDAQGCTTPDAGPPVDGGGVSFTLGQIENVSLQWLYLQCDENCQQQASALGTDQQCQSTWANGPSWTINGADLRAVEGPDASISIAEIGSQAAQAPVVTVLGVKRGGLAVYEKSDRPDESVHPSGHLFRISMVAGAESNLQGAGPSSTGANICAGLRQLNNGVCEPAPPPASGATECPSGWWPINQRGAWATGGVIYAFGRSDVPESAICGVDVSILDWDPTSAPWSIDEITVSAITDPVQNWINGYVNAATAIAGGQAGRVAFGTDFNGLNGLMEISENAVPAGALAASSCPVSGDSPNDAGPLPLAPMRFRYSDGTLGNQVLIDERGLATYGLLADLLAILPTHSACGQSVHDSLMLSAEATIRAWEAIENPTRAAPTMPVMTFPCGGGGDAGNADASPSEDSGAVDAAGTVR